MPDPDTASNITDKLTIVWRISLVGLIVEHAIMRVPAVPIPATYSLRRIAGFVCTPFAEQR